MSILITGAAGQLGQHLCKALQNAGLKYTAANRQQLDICQHGQLTAIINTLRPTIIINCAAYTAVDLAETEPALCEAINHHAVANLAASCQQRNILLIHFSTDYVFDGTKLSRYTELDAPNPLNQYGKTKLAGEIAIRQSQCRHYIIRTSWLYSEIGRNFYTTMQQLSQQRQPVKVVTDQTGTPTHAAMLAGIIVKLIQPPLIPFGTYHCAGDDIMSWYQFAQRIFKQQASDTQLLPIFSNEYPSAATRPTNSALSSKKLSTRLRYRSEI